MDSLMCIHRKYRRSLFQNLAAVPIVRYEFEYRTVKYENKFLNWFLSVNPLGL